MKRLLCWLFGHSWIVEGWYDRDTMQVRCTTCGHIYPVKRKATND